jgi:hypothetical protein
VDRHRPAKRLDAVAEPHQPPAARRVGAADAIVADQHVQAVATWLDADADDGGVGVLGGVAERLGDDEVGGHLDRVRQLLLQINVEVHGEGGAAGQRHERRAEAALRQGRRVDAARQLLQLLQRILKPVGEPGQLGLQLRGLGRHGGLGGAQVQPQRYHPLLDTLV